MRDYRSNTLVIRTPEGISFSLLLAGPAARFLAWAVDLAFIFVIGSFLSKMLSVFGLLSMDISRALVFLMYFGVSIGYGIVLEWFLRGQTLGKRLLRLRVMDEQGLRLQFSQVVIRNLMRFVDSLPFLYLVGGVACLVSTRAQRLGDYVANTIVIRSQPGLEYDHAKITPDKYNSFREYPHLEARLRRQVSSREMSLALVALMRREELDPHPRLMLFRDMASHFRSLVDFPDEATFGLTDEQISQKRGE